MEHCVTDLLRLAEIEFRVTLVLVKAPLPIKGPSLEALHHPICRQQAPAGSSERAVRRLLHKAGRDSHAAL